MLVNYDYYSFAIQFVVYSSLPKLPKPSIYDIDKE